MAFIKNPLLLLLLCLLVTTCVLGKNIDSQAQSSSVKPAQVQLEPVALNAQMKASTSVLNLSGSPLFVNNFGTTILTWLPFINSSTANITLADTAGNTRHISTSDNGSYPVHWSHYPFVAYVYVTVSNNYGSATILPAVFLNRGQLVTSPNTSSTYSTNSQDVYAKWDPDFGFGSSIGVTVVNISFVDQVTQLNHTFFNLPNNGSATLDISTFGLPASNYTVYVLGYLSDNPLNDLLGEYSATFTISSPPSGAIRPGVYLADVSNSLSSGNSTDFIVYSSTGLNVSVDTTAPITPEDRLNVTWTPAANLTSYNATLVLVDASNPSLIFTNVTVEDLGSASVNISSFGNIPPGHYNLIVDGTLGSGVSSVFQIVSSSPLNVTLSSYSSVVNSTITATWSPSNSLGTANVTLLQLSNGTLIPVATAIADNGNYTFNLTYAPSAYLVLVNTSLGSGSSSVLYITTTLNVTSPNASTILYANTTDAPFVWSPSDNSTGNVTIIFTDLNTNQTFNVSVPNTGSASVNLSALHLPPGSYQATVGSALGSGTSPIFVIRSPVALNVIQPNITTNVSDVGLLDVVWDPSNPSGSNATITLYDLSYPPTTYNFSAVDIGNATINLDAETVNKNLFTSFTSSSTILPSVKEPLNRRKTVKA